MCTYCVCVYTHYHSPHVCVSGIHITHTHKYTHKYTHTHAHTHTHKHTHKHTHTHLYTNTPTHTPRKLDRRCRISHHKSSWARYIQSSWARYIHTHTQEARQALPNLLQLARPVSGRRRSRLDDLDEVNGKLVRDGLAPGLEKKIKSQCPSIPYTVSYTVQRANCSRCACSRTKKRKNS